MERSRRWRGKIEQVGEGLLSQQVDATGYTRPRREASRDR
jgi:hypothetical protein